MENTTPSLPEGVFRGIFHRVEKEFEEGHLGGFREYYLEYMGVDPVQLEHGERVFPSIQRVKPESGLSHSRHHLIVSLREGTLIHSVAPALLPAYREVAPASFGPDIQKHVDDAFASVYPGRFYNIRRMLRFSTERLFPPDPEVCTLTEDDRDLVMNRMSQRGEKVRERFWHSAMLPMIRDGRMLSVVREGSELARSNVTLLPCGSANIDVWTRPDMRRRGLGAAVVRQAVNWCLLNGQVPIYLVHRENTPSVNLALSLGMEMKADEVQTVVVRY